MHEKCEWVTSFCHPISNGKSCYKEKGNLSEIKVLIEMVKTRNKFIFEGDTSSGINDKLSLLRQIACVLINSTSSEKLSFENCKEK